MKASLRTVAVVLLGFPAFPQLSPAADRVFLDFADEEYLRAHVQTTDANATLLLVNDREVLRVTTGARAPWPGVTLKSPTAAWNLADRATVMVELTNSGTNTVTVNCRVDNPGADGTKHCLTGSLTLEPRRSGTLWVPLQRASESRLGGKLFGMRGYPVVAGGPGTIDPRQVNQVLLFVNKPTQNHRFDVRAIRAVDIYTPPTAWATDADPFFPFIDALGQYRHKHWPGKTRSGADLAAQRESEAKRLAARSGPQAWDQYGGWAAGPQLRATGFFRTEKHAGKWWLVDPEGRLFWSHGIDCVRMLDATPIDERESWFEDFPGNQPEFQAFIIPQAYALKGHYAGRSPRCFSFAGANLLRKYGPDWKQTYPEVIHRRLRTWGLNTIANWSDEGVRLMRRTPYTDAVSSGGTRIIEGSEGYWGKFPDVFDPGFEHNLRQGMAGKQERSANDPWCIGYFSDNEMSWGDEVSVAIGALKSPPDQPAKLALVEDLKLRYRDVAKLNAAWGTTHASWDALVQSREAPDRQKADADLKAFYTQAAERYFRTVRDAIKAVAPNQLYLGCRFAWGNARAATAAAKYCDVVSYNIYKLGVADFQFNGGADVPLIIGEFHFGALDRGMFHTGLVPVSDQRRRAGAYESYVQGALRHPQFVGTHWFQYQDEPTTGRVLDEENYQIGFVDIADTPYAEMITVSRAVAEGMYALRARN